MCDKANRAEKAELQAAAREDATTAATQVTARKDADSKKAQVVDRSLLAQKTRTMTVTTRIPIVVP